MSHTQWLNLKPSDILTSAEMKTLTPRSDGWGWWLTLHAWGVIAGCTALYAMFPSIWTALIAVILVGGRQLGLAVLMHEASHGLMFKSRRANEWVGQWLIAAPVLIDMYVYRTRHMAHHRFTRTEKDPENFLYTPFPVSRASMTRKIIRDLTGIVFLRTQLGIFMYIWGEEADGRGVRLRQAYVGPLLINALFIAFALFFGRIDVWLVCWLIPLMTTQQLFLRIRNIAEHAAVPDLDDPLKNSRTTIANWFERATVAPYYVNYHIEHHLMPFIPCFRLRDLHNILIEKGYGPDMEIQHGYRDVLAVNTGAS